VSADDWQRQMQEALSAFAIVAELAGAPFPAALLQVEFHSAPHRQPKRLPTGKMAVYAFWGVGEWLKIGKAGPKSNARYTSQHYSPRSARSTLAQSLAHDTRLSHLAGFDPDDPGAWIRRYTHRVNVLLPAERGGALLALLEAFLHMRLSPRYEG
jgi:hypothetical protein